MNKYHRAKFFNRIREVAENQHFDEAKTSELFISLFEIHSEREEGVITVENMTEEEKNIVRVHLRDFLLKTGMFFHGSLVTPTPRELLSGVTVFRLEVMPVLITLFPQKKSMVIADYMSSLAKIESRILHRIGISGYNGNSFVGTQKFELPTYMWYLDKKKPSGFHALHKHPWWSENYCRMYKEFDVVLQWKEEIVSNYELAD